MAKKQTKERASGPELLTDFCEWLSKKWPEGIAVYDHGRAVLVAHGTNADKLHSIVHEFCKVKDLPKPKICNRMTKLIRRYDTTRDEELVLLEMILDLATSKEAQKDNGDGYIQRAYGRLADTANTVAALREQRIENKTPHLECATTASLLKEIASRTEN